MAITFSLFIDRYLVITVCTTYCRYAPQYRYRYPKPGEKITERFLKYTYYQGLYYAKMVWADTDKVDGEKDIKLLKRTD